MTDLTKAPALVPGAQRNALHLPPALPGAAAPSTPSQYASPCPQPPIEIAGVDPGRNVYSPLQPIAPFGPPAITYPREWDYPPGVNLDIVPARLGVFEMLRLMSQSWGILRTVIETRKDQILRQPWTIKSRANPRGANARIAELASFFKKPDGKNRWDRWFRLLLEDLLVIDAATLYTGWRRADGKPYVIEVLDGATIKPLIDDVGRRPDYPSPAYQQIIKGLPMVDFDESEILYAPMRPRPQMPLFGYPPTEQILVEAAQGIQRALYQANFWREGTLPELIMTVPAGWTAAQISQFQQMFDTATAGDLTQKSRIRFVPDGMKPFDIKNANGEGLKADYDEWLATIVCYAYSVSKQPFVRLMNRATAETAQEAAEEEGLHPLMTWFKTEIMDPIIQEKQYGFGYDDLEFVFLPQQETDPQKQMLVLSGFVKEGIKTRNEARAELNLAALPGGDALTVDTPAGPVAITALAPSFSRAREKVSFASANDG